MTTIHDLPIELLRMIFRYLGFKDLIQARLVCKLWKFFCDQQPVEELIIKSKNSRPENRWFHTKKPIKLDNVIRLDEPFDGNYLVFRKKLINCHLLRGLKCLKICQNENVSYGCNRALSQLSKFNQLEQLDLEITFGDCYDILIVHPNLKILNVDSELYRDCVFEVDAEKLESFRFIDYLAFVKFIYPESIRHLDAQICDVELTGETIKWTDFKNLQSLKCGRFNFVIDADFLIQLPRLKMLVYDEKISDLGDLIDHHDEYFFCEEILKRLIEKKEALKREDLKIYLDEIEITSIKQFKRILTEEFGESFFEGLEDESMEVNN